MIYHIVTEKEFIIQNNGLRYQPVKFDDTGFVHCAQEQSVIPVANDYYASVEENLLLLRIDPANLESELKYEAATPATGAGTDHLASAPAFPHIYGPVNNSSIDGIGRLVKGIKGYAWPIEFVSLIEWMNKK